MSSPHAVPQYPCRLCGAVLSRTFVDLGCSPLSNSYLREAQLHQMEPHYPLHTYVCERCLLVQLPEVEKPAHIFAEEYLYFSSYSASWLAHAEAYARAMCERFGLDESSFVVEAASNDGYLLQYFKARGVPVLGVEPAGNVAKVAVEQRGIPSEVAFFGVEEPRTKTRLAHPYGRSHHTRVRTVSFRVALAGVGAQKNKRGKLRKTHSVSSSSARKRLECKSTARRVEIEHTGAQP